MGCIQSRCGKDDSLCRSKERRKLIRQVIRCRNEFAVSQIAYLQALKNTGITLKQFAEVESGDFNITTQPPVRVSFPPPPPPPPPLSPSHTNVTPPPEEISGTDKPIQENVEIDDSGSHTPPPPSTDGAAWEFWDPFALASPSRQRTEISQNLEDEDWAETKTEFEDDEQPIEALLLPPKLAAAPREMDDCSSVMSWYTKDTELGMVVWRTQKSLAGIVKDLDDYFLKASAGGNEIPVLLEKSKNTAFCSLRGKNERSGRSAKVFSSLSWSRSSKSLLSGRETVGSQSNDETHEVANHSKTLENLYAEEHKLYKDIKAHESAKVEHKNMVRSLQNQEALGETSMKVEKIKTRIDELHSRINSLELAIATSLSTIAKLRDEDLHAQLLELSTGLMRMWRIMYESHQVQNHIALQLNNLNEQNHEATTEYHRMSSVQLESEATGLCKSFCNLMKAQRQYMHTLNAWMKLTSDISGQGSHANTLSFCEHWQLALDRLPDKVAADAIRSFISIIHSIAVQQAEEYSLRKKMERRDKQLDMKLKSLTLMESKYCGGFDLSFENPKHPLFVKRANTDAFKKRVDEERDRYQNCVQATRAMVLNNLQTGLPNLFQALMGFSSVTVQAYEALCKEG